MLQDFLPRDLEMIDLAAESLFGLGRAAPQASGSSASSAARR